MPFASFDISEYDLDRLHGNVFKHTVAESLQFNFSTFENIKKFSVPFIVRCIFAINHYMKRINAKN